MPAILLQVMFLPSFIEHLVAQARQSKVNKYSTWLDAKSFFVSDIISE